MTDKPKPDDQHAEYAAMAPVWKKCRDARTGQRAIHAGGEAYLPCLSEQTDDEYKAYKARASFFNATRRTVDSMTGLVFRKAPIIVAPEAMKDWLKDITLGGLSLEGLARVGVEDVITVARAGILVEHPPEPQLEPNVRITQGQASAIGLRPYLAYFKAEDVLNWKKARVGNVTILVSLHLQEPYEDAGITKTQIRQLTLENGFYEQVIFRKNARDEWEEVSRIAPRKQGTVMKEIPFFFLAPSEPDCNVQDSPIEDLVNVNVSHYMNSADLENGAHISGIPTPYITGYQPEFNANGVQTNKIYLGSTTILLLPNPDSEVGFLQLDVDGFAALEKLMDRKEAQMAALGARMLAPEKKAAEAAETAGIRRGGENSVLASIAGAVEMQIQKALAFLADWGGISGDVTAFSLNKDYLPMPIDSAMLTSLVAALNSGAISQETFFECLQAGEMVDENLTFEDEQERKKAEGPPLGMIGREDPANGDD